MYGLIGKIRAEPGRRDDLVAILTESDGGMPGCFSYVIAIDEADHDAIWVTEVWDSVESHKASLTLPAVQHAITRGRPLIAAFETYVQTVPMGGIGLPKA